MLVFVIRRLLVTVPVLLAASMFSFALIDVTGDPLADLLVQQPPPSQEVIQAERERLYLDRPAYERYWLWLTGIGGNGDIGLLQGEFGPSVQGPAFDVGAEVAARMGVTLRLVAAAVLLALGLAVATGVVSAMRQYSVVDHTLTFIGFLALAMPTFWLGALIKEAGVWANGQLGTTVFSTIGASAADTRGMGLWERIADAGGHLVLPTVALMLTGYAAWSRYQRTAMLEVLNSDYVRLAHAKGLRRRTVMRRHALRTALIPLTSVAAVTIAEILAGTVLIETVFQWRGMGTLLVEAVRTSDAYVLMGWLMLAGTLVVLANLAADLLYGVLDPRIRYE
ncbi:ABC transporter permease [Nocardiopsis baichengensis]|uniref:ABC transporter permease n=1 Tax=Nocardiopsis baichengensis TaxID=280240 RepID=UPI00034D2998|nr:ABC transporter permease [Nocardiopsis baichengensis]